MDKYYIMLAICNSIIFDRELIPLFSLFLVFAESIEEKRCKYFPNNLNMCKSMKQTEHAGARFLGRFDTIPPRSESLLRSCIRNTCVRDFENDPRCISNRCEQRTTVNGS